MMNTKTTGITLGSALLGFASAFLVGLFLFHGGQQADAQNNSNNNNSSARETAARVTHTARYLNAIQAKEEGEEVLETHAFPGSPVFLVRTKKHVMVWERRENSLNSLMTIPVENDFKDLIFLDDHRTFVIQTKKAVGVYSIDKRIPATTRQTASSNNR